MIYAHFSPQFSTSKEVEYKFEEEQKLIINYNDVKEEIDFSDLPDGELEMPEGDDEELLEGMPDGLIKSAHKEDGDLYITLRRYYSDPDAPEEITHPPEWQEIEVGETYG